MTYSVRYIDRKGQDRWTVLPVKTHGAGRKAQIAQAMRRIFGDVTVIAIAVARG